MFCFIYTLASFNDTASTVEFIRLPLKWKDDDKWWKSVEGQSTSCANTSEVCRAPTVGLI